MAYSRTDGRRSSGGDIENFSRGKFPSGIPITDNGTNCMAVKLADGGIVGVLAECSKSLKIANIICEMELLPADCTAEHTGVSMTVVNDSCYAILKPNGPSFDWFTAQNMCHDLNHKTGRLVDDWRSGTLETLLIGQDLIWTGFVRKRWHWRDETEPMHYFNWFVEDDDFVSGTRCMLVNREGIWFQQDCSVGTPYYLCMNDTASESTISTNSLLSTSMTTASIYPISKSSAHTEMEITPAASDRELERAKPTFELVTNVRDDDSMNTTTRDRNHDLAVYVGAAAGGLVVLVLIVVSIVCSRRKERHGDSSVPNDIVQPNATDREAPEASAQCEMVPDHFSPTTDSSDHIDDLVSPYAEFGGGPHLSHNAAANHAESAYDVGHRELVGEAHANPMLNGDTGGSVVENVGSVDTDAASANVYATVNKPKITDSEPEDMDDIVVDNVMYGVM